MQDAAPSGHQIHFKEKSHEALTFAFTFFAVSTKMKNWRRWKPKEVEYENRVWRCKGKQSLGGYLIRHRATPRRQNFAIFFINYLLITFRFSSIRQSLTFVLLFSKQADRKAGNQLVVVLWSAKQRDQANFNRKL